MLHDFTFRDPLEILAELQGGSGHAGHAMGGMETAMLNDITFDAYLANDRTLADPEIVRVGRATANPFADHQWVSRQQYVD